MRPDRVALAALAERVEREDRRALSPTMLRALGRAPVDWSAIPSKIYGYPGAGQDFSLRFNTVTALSNRGLVLMRLRGRPRAKWQWRVTPTGSAHAADGGSHG